MPSSTRRFPPPWTIEELDACFVVRDHDGQALAYVYYEEEPGRRSAAKLLGMLGLHLRLAYESVHGWFDSRA
jgi:hypothetical protein